MQAEASKDKGMCSKYLHGLELMASIGSWELKHSNLETSKSYWIVCLVNTDH